MEDPVPTVSSESFRHHFQCQTPSPPKVYRLCCLLHCFPSRRFICCFKHLTGIWACAARTISALSLPGRARHCTPRWPRSSWQKSLSIAVCFVAQQIRSACVEVRGGVPNMHAHILKRKLAFKIVARSRSSVDRSTVLFSFGGQRSGGVFV